MCIIAKAINKIRKWFRQIIGARIYTIELPASAVDRIIYEKLRNKDVEIIPLDLWFVAPLTIKDAQEVVKLWMKHIRKYVPEVFDCDDFANCFKCFTSYALNINGFYTVYDYGMGHAYNLYVEWPDKLYVIEPQTGEIMPQEDTEKRGYLKGPLKVVV